jgi:hypothetical protein
MSAVNIQLFKAGYGQWLNDLTDAYNRMVNSDEFEKVVDDFDEWWGKLFPDGDSPEEMDTKLTHFHERASEYRMDLHRK